MTNSSTSYKMFASCYLLSDQGFDARFNFRSSPFGFNEQHLYIRQNDIKKMTILVLHFIIQMFRLIRMQVVEHGLSTLSMKTRDVPDSAWPVIALQVSTGTNWY